MIYLIKKSNLRINSPKRPDSKDADHEGSKCTPEKVRKKSTEFVGDLAYEIPECQVKGHFLTGSYSHKWVNDRP